MEAAIPFRIHDSSFATYCMAIPFTVCVLFFSYVAVLRFLQLPETRIPDQVEYNKKVHPVDRSIFEIVKEELNGLPSNCSYTTHADDDDDESIVVKKVRRDASSRRNCEADYAPEFDCWGTHRKRRKGRDYIGYASVWYILSLVVRRKMKL